MDNMIVWLALGGAGVVILISILLLQKKSNLIKKISADLAQAQEEDKKKGQKLENLQNTFEEKMDAVVEASIQKIAHAEQAKEEAIQAAQDNYEAVADAHALMKEKDALIKKLQSN